MIGHTTANEHNGDMAAKLTEEHDEGSNAAEHTVQLLQTLDRYKDQHEDQEDVEELASAAPTGPSPSVASSIASVSNREILTGCDNCICNHHFGHVVERLSVTILHSPGQLISSLMFMWVAALLIASRGHPPTSPDTASLEVLVRCFVC